MSFIEDKNEDGYTVRTDLMKDGESIQCVEDKDMHIKKEGNSALLVKKCFMNKCFSK